MKSTMLLFGVLFFTLAAGRVSSQTTASPQTQPQNNVRKAVPWKQFDYTCEGRAKLTVYLRGDMAKVRYQDHAYLMKQTVSADGNRYSDGKVVWWGKGNGGFLQEDASEGNGKMIVQGCQLDKPLNSDAGSNTISGTVTYLQRMALPPTAVLQVQLIDTSLADAPFRVVAEQIITMGDQQVPLPFTLNYDPSKIDPKHSYSVSAKITLDKTLRFVSDKAYPVLTQSNPSHVDIVLKSASSHSMK